MRLLIRLLGVLFGRIKTRATYRYRANPGVIFPLFRTVLNKSEVDHLMIIFNGTLFHA